MQLNAFDPITLALALALLALVPTIVVISTTFLKIAVVMSLVRNALGIQQIPPNLALYGLALILTFYIMAPIGQRIFEEVAADPAAPAERVTEALRAAGVSFEVETIERVKPGGDGYGTPQRSAAPPPR
ncbi:MAG: hypothetical protein EB136_10535 [Synechococcaceae bacterium WBB_3_034]|nr:hypothetical protein [Synechococcaceae bacterium WBB_3_034]